MSVHVKICGLGRPEDVAACVAAKARYVGFTFFEKSPRYVTFAKARELALAVPPGLAKVALSVNADDATLEALLAEVPIDVLQLHGNESPDRVAEVKARFKLPVMKAVGISDEEDLPKIDEFSQVADQLLIDAKPPKGGALPGGNGLTFDWRLIAGRRFSVPWILAGGLTSANVAEAVRRTGATQVDLSSGVESAPGVKDAKLIHEFVAAAQGTADA